MHLRVEEPFQGETLPPFPLLRAAISPVGLVSGRSFSPPAGLPGQPEPLPLTAGGGMKRGAEAGEVEDRRVFHRRSTQWQLAVGQN